MKSRLFLVSVMALLALLCAPVQAQDERPSLKPGEWVMALEMDDVIFPSAIIAISTMKPDEKPEPNHLGDPLGMVGASVCAPRAGSTIEVEVSAGKTVRPSVFRGKMGKAGEIYHAYPVLKYDYDVLLGTRQSTPEVITVKVKIDGKDAGEKTRRVVVRPITECLMGFESDEGEYSNTSWMFASYVNEDHPMIDIILREALDSADTESFAGYQGSSEDVIKEINAIWNALKARGFKYSSITTTSQEGGKIHTQHVRLLGDSLKHSQSNCVDGSVLMASIFRKIGLNASLVLVPGHMFVGVDLDSQGEETAYIETTMLANADLGEAVEAGVTTFEKNREGFEKAQESGDFSEYSIISIAEARKIGILPLKDVKAE